MKRGRKVSIFRQQQSQQYIQNFEFFEPFCDIMQRGLKATFNVDNDSMKFLFGASVFVNGHFSLHSVFYFS